MRHALAATLSTAATLATALALGQPRAAIPTLPIALRITAEHGTPVRDRPWIDAQLAAAERHFGQHGIRFRPTAFRPLDARHARMESRDDRDGLAAELAPGVINVFVVASLADVDEPGRMRFGVHWRRRDRPSQHYVILSASAPVDVLAHELGHFLGNGHSRVPDNLMSYERTGAALFLDASQVARSRATALGYIERGELIVPARRARP